MKYTINSAAVLRKEFFAALKEDCNKAAPERYEQCKRNLRSGHMLVFLHSGRTYASYRV